MEHKFDSFDRRKGTDRYNRDGGGYDLELLKGFRSKRDRSRHEGSGSRALSWRRKGFRDMRLLTWSNSRYSGSEQSRDPDFLQVEAMKVRVCLVWVIARDFKKIHFDSDSLQIVKALWNPLINLTLIGQAMEDIKVLIPDSH
ncbi:hypothetical protein D8674_012753 [Pyrus ussuriensis x Pyrus communis]|uniref:RNase H type-1 domain-containing protein n=1 Tax=Pyrus ussuriensis x Pyrus communis TaxID=2448454 RepID=A0A5N5H1E0_9ROSA|nr:hypothetical protein D8674_012753 [Pyrus ussuriensis x Pyrus communis]